MRDAARHRRASCAIASASIATGASARSTRAARAWRRCSPAKSGTGKTLAAEVIANEVELDLYRIDLATLVSKYIGETEKNLKRLFDAAETSGAVLLFDEADALFGKRSEVKDSHDRYANIEIAYLLQRIEAYRGLAILTTNMKSALDRAFLRRIRFVVSFPFPDAAAREQIWRRQFPADAPLRRDRLRGARAPQPRRRQHPQRRAQRRLQGGRCRRRDRPGAAGGGRARGVREARTLDGPRGDGRHGMKLAAWTSASGLVVDGAHRGWRRAGAMNWPVAAGRADGASTSVRRSTDEDGAAVPRDRARLTKRSGGAA